MEATKPSAAKIIKDIRLVIRKQYGAEEKIHIVLDGLRGEESIAASCRREGIAESLCFNLAYAVTPGATTDFIDYVVHELQARGRAQTSYKQGTFRQKPIGTADGRVEPTHPVYAYREACKDRESVADKTQPSPFANAKILVAAQ